MSAEIFPRDKRSISRRGAGLEWQRLREQCATTVTRGSIMNAIQYLNAIVQRTGIECFEITFREAKFIANIISSALFIILSISSFIAILYRCEILAENGAQKSYYNIVMPIYLVVVL